MMALWDAAVVSGRFCVRASCRRRAVPIDHAYDGCDEAAGGACAHGVDGHPLAYLLGVPLLLLLPVPEPSGYDLVAEIDHGPGVDDGRALGLQDSFSFSTHAASPIGASAHGRLCVPMGVV